MFDSEKMATETVDFDKIATRVSKIRNFESIANVFWQQLKVLSLGGEMKTFSYIHSSVLYYSVSPADLDKFFIRRIKIYSYSKYIPE